MRIAVVLLTSGLWLVASGAAADNCPNCGGGYPGADLAGYGYGGGLGNAYGNCDFGSSLWAGYCSEPICGCGRRGRMKGGLFGKCRDACCGSCDSCGGCSTWWYGYGGGPCGFAGKKGRGCGLDCCGTATGWMDGLRHRFAGRGWQHGLMVGEGGCCGYPYGGMGTGCASGIGSGGYAGAGCAGGTVSPSAAQPAAEVDSWQGSAFDYSTQTMESPTQDSGPFYESPPALLPESPSGAAAGEELPAADPSLNDA